MGPRRSALALALAGALALGAAAPAPPPPDGRVLDQLLAPRGAPDLPGTSYRGFTTTLPDPRGGPIRGDVVEVDLTSPAVRVDLLTPPTVAAVATVPELAGRAGAVAAVNGGFFDEGGSGAPVGAEIVAGAPRSSGVPVGRRPAPPVPPGEDADTVVGIDRAGRAHLARVQFRGRLVAGRRTVPLAGLDGYAVPVDGVGVFDPAWGDASREAATCGSDTDPRAGCSTDTLEVRVAGGRVTAVGPPGEGRLPAGTLALVGRERGAASLRALPVGTRVSRRLPLRRRRRPAAARRRRGPAARARRASPAGPAGHRARAPHRGRPVGGRAAAVARHRRRAPGREHRDHPRRARAPAHRPRRARRRVPRRRGLDDHGPARA